MLLSRQFLTFTDVKTKHPELCMLMPVQVEFKR